MMRCSVLLIGGSGKEHAIAWKLSESSEIDHIYVSPGNAGTKKRWKVSNCDINLNSYSAVYNFCQSNNIGLVVVGPKDPLANGISDYLARKKILCFGPCKKATKIETSREFAKQFMDKHQIPTGQWKSFTNADEAKQYILNAPYEALVVKASGIAAGKGVIVASSKEEAVKAIDSLKEDKGQTSATIFIEELLSGKEVSVLCFSDGNTVSVMPSLQRYKHLLDDDKGPITGGMGAYCRCPFVDTNQLESIQTEILEKAINGMKKDGMPFIGILNARLIMTLDGPKVLKFNCTFGDPDAQVILPLLVSDLYVTMLSCVNGTLSNMTVEWSQYRSSVGVVMVSTGYPGSYDKGYVIEGLGSHENQSGYFVFHGGTSISSGKIVTSGGRVLTIVGVGFSLFEAVTLTQKGCKTVRFKGKYHRSDIAQPVSPRIFGGKQIGGKQEDRKRTSGAVKKKPKKCRTPNAALTFREIFGSPLRFSVDSTEDKNLKAKTSHQPVKEKSQSSSSSTLVSSKTEKEPKIKSEKHKEKPPKLSKAVHQSSTELLESSDFDKSQGSINNYSKKRKHYSKHKKDDPPPKPLQPFKLFSTKDDSCGNSKVAKKKFVKELCTTPLPTDALTMKKTFSSPDITQKSSILLNKERYSESCCNSQVEDSDLNWFYDGSMYSTSSSEFEGFCSSPERIKELSSDISSVHTSDLSSFDDEISVDDPSDEDERQLPARKLKRKLTLKEAQTLLKMREEERSLTEENSTIIGADIIGGKLMFLIRRRENCEQFYPAAVVKKRIPQAVISFYEKHLVFHK